MSKIIDDIRTDFPSFWRLGISKAGNRYRKTFFDEVNASLLFERLAESSEHDDLALVMPEDPTVTPLLIIESLLCLLKLDSLNSPSSFLDTLSVGDDVLVLPFNGGRSMKPGIFDGKEIKNGTTGYRVRELSDPKSVTWYPEKTKWRIKPYTSQESGKRRGMGIATGQELESLMQLAPGDLLSIQQSKGLIVTPNKGKLKEEIKEISIGGDSIESIFPIADFTDPSTPKPLLADPLRREYILGLVSNSDMAVDICFNDPSYKLIIIIGATKVRASYDHITRLNADKNPRKIVCILNSSDEEELRTLNSMGVDCWVWKKTDFEQIDLKGSESETVTSDFTYHNKVTSYIGRSATELISVHDDDIESSLNILTKVLRSLYKNTPPSEEAGALIRRLYSYLKFFLQVPITIRDYERYCFSNGIQLLTDRISDLEQELIKSFGYIFPRDTQADVKLAIAEIKKLYQLLENRNPKKTELMRLLQNNSDDTTLVCSRADIATILRNDHSIADTVKIVTTNELRLEPKNRVIYTSFFTMKFQSKLFLAPFLKNLFIFYGQEQKWHENLYLRHPASPRAVIDAKLRKQYSSQIETDTPPLETSEHILEDSFETIFNSVDVKFGYSTDLNSSYALNFIPSEENALAHRVVFEDDKFTFLDDDHHLSKLDRINAEVVRVNLHQLSVDDEIVFADSSRNLFDDLLTDIKSSGKYSELENLASMWWQSLNRYASLNRLSVVDIKEQLDLVGCRRHVITIREWMKGERIGPLEIEKTLPAIAKVTNDADLLSKLDHVTRACKELHSVHIQVGRLLVKRIVNSVLDRGEADILDEDMKEKIELYASRAQVEVVTDIKSTTENVPSNSIGELFTPGDIS